MSKTKKILALILMLSGLSFGGDWTGASTIASIEIYPGDGTANRPPAAVVTLSSHSTRYGFYTGFPAVQEMLNSLVQAKVNGQDVNLYVTTGGVLLTYYYKGNYGNWSSANVDNLHVVKLQ